MRHLLTLSLFPKEVWISIETSRKYSAKGFGEKGMVTKEKLPRFDKKLQYFGFF